MSDTIRRKLSIGSRFCMVAAVVSALTALGLAPSAAAQTCDPSLATWTTTIPVGSPPTFFSLNPFPFHPIAPPETWTFTNVFTNQSWASIVSFSNTGMTFQLNANGLSPGWNCFAIEFGAIDTLPRNPTTGEPCGGNFDPTAGWFNLNSTAPFPGPCEYKETPDGVSEGYPAALFGGVAVDVVAGNSVSIVDPVPVLMSGNAVVAIPDPTKGTVVLGVAADGVTQVVISIGTTSPGHTFTITLLDDQGLSGSSTISSEDGALGVLGSTNPSSGHVTVTAGKADSHGLGHAFALYLAPVDFARPITVGGFKKGSCGSVTNTGDDQLKCRSVSLQIMDITSNTALPTTSITIVRPPVILVHGIWGNQYDWDNFNPLVSDSRFSILRFNYDAIIGAQISNPSPSYQTVANARQNSLGFQYNANELYLAVTKWINAFKAGKNNPANIAVAAVQADIVAHSMGGDITRTMALSPTFLDDPITPTFGQGSVHKLITIDTPHLGSPLGSKLLLSSNNCTRGVLAGNGGYYSFTSVTLAGSGTSVCGTATNSVCGAVGDMDPSSPALNNINKPPQPQPYYFPTALIAGIYTNFASLNCQGFGTGCGAAKMRTYCKNDPLAQSLTSDGWPDNFGLAGSNKNDGIVPLSSQLNTSISNPDPNLGSQFTGYAHSKGITVLSFTRPSVLDPDVVPPKTISIPQTVINLLNTPVTNHTVFALINP
jgi:pimeloyl-ACP methyl ester carboxylesterase